MILRLRLQSEHDSPYHREAARDGGPVCRGHAGPGADRGSVRRAARSPGPGRRGGAVSGTRGQEVDPAVGQDGRGHRASDDQERTGPAGSAD